MLRHIVLLASSILSIQPVLVSGASYNLKDNFVGSGFLTGFQHQAIPDPTNGRVNYVNQRTALAQNLTFVSEDTLIMRADSTTTLKPKGAGRNSVRIRSKNTYTTHVAIFDIRHMPEGCSTWPAVWETLEDDWPNSGEVDIVEGVNDVSPNEVTLHTNAGCTMPTNQRMTGTSISTDCDISVNDEEGCIVENRKVNSYGPEFNAAGGGWYAMERTSTFIRVFFWPRNDDSVPTDVKNGGSSVDTSEWGHPEALFPNTECDLASHFGSHNIIINLTLCGDWAGERSLFNSAGCPGSCVDFVNNNPSAFKNAFWDIAAVRVYE